MIISLGPYLQCSHKRQYMRLMHNVGYICVQCTVHCRFLYPALQEKEQGVASPLTPGVYRLGRLALLHSQLSLKTDDFIQNNNFKIMGK